MTLNREEYKQNRESSWINYSARILEEARDKTVPVLERFSYIATFMSNIEQYLRLKPGQLIGEPFTGHDMATPGAELSPDEVDAIYEMIQDLIIKKDSAHISAEADLEEAGVKRLGMLDLLPEYLEIIDNVYNEQVKEKIKSHIVSGNGDLPVFEQERPYIVTRLNYGDKTQYGVLEIPTDIPKVIILDEGMPYINNVGLNAAGLRKTLTQHFSQHCKYILVEDIIKMHAPEFFEPFETVEMHTFGLSVSDNPDTNTLMVDGVLSKEMYRYMLATFSIYESQTFRTNVIDYSFVHELKSKLPIWIRERLCWLKDEPFNQLKLGYGSIIDRLKRRDLLSCYPYDTMDPVFKLLDECSEDDRVTEVRITLTQLSSHPSILDYLKQVSNDGKLVTVLMEEDIHYDKRWDIDWTEELKMCGVNVIYAGKRFKLHTSMLQIVMVENGKTSYITHFTTGDFVEEKAAKCTDLGLFTGDDRVGISANAYWHNLCDNKLGTYANLLTTPLDLKRKVLELIRTEAGKGEDGRIFIKVNGLTDEDVIDELKNASVAGCKIRLIVRGICCLLPGIKGQTDNIDIVNVVGRYLEHSRVYMFGKEGHEAMFISSADLMTRNMNRNFEFACPIYSAELRKRIKAIMYLNYVDNVKGRHLGSDGKYSRKFNGDKRINSQEMLMG